jgi:hypothetical protein
MPFPPAGALETELLMTSDDDERRQLERLRQEMLRERGEFPVEHVNAAFDRVVADFDGAPVRTFVPVLARRRLRQELSGGR